MAGPRSSIGIGRSGTNPTSPPTGTERPRTSTSSTITPSMPCGARCPRRAWAGRTRRAAAALHAELPEARRQRHELRDGQDRHADGLSVLSRERLAAFVDGHVRMGIATNFATWTRVSRSIARIPELKNMPIVIGESDPDGCAACEGPQLGYRNTTMYSSYTAAAFARRARFRRAARRQPRRGADVGVRVRETSRFLPAAHHGEQRHRPACVERFPYVQPNGRPPFEAEVPPKSRSTTYANGVHGKPDVGAVASAGPKKAHRSSSGITTMTTCPARTRPIELKLDHLPFGRRGDVDPLPH